MDAKQVPLRELLASIPEDARLVIDDADVKGTRFIPVGRLCQEAAAALAEPVQEPVAWRFKAMIGLPWSLSDDGYYISCKRDQSYFVEALYTAPPQRKPIAEWQINDLMADIDPEDVCSWSFRQGVYAAEKHHGVRP